ncbi:MAG: hypothetical protein KAR06_03745 [Deltaproteobacteria bacterium]|nr:hypothetical protein [Deltaproteobacteria bacterium]
MAKGDITTILTATTSAGNSSHFYVRPDANVTIMPDIDLGAAETADVQISDDNGTTFKDYIDGSAVELTATKNAIRLYGPAVYRVAKDATASATAIILQE